MDYSQVEEQFKTLKDQFTAGTLDEAAFKAKLNELMVQDGQGHWWMIGYETGQWYTHDGSAWVRSDPPGRAAPAPTQPPKASAAAAPAKPDQPVKQNGAQSAAPLATPAERRMPETPSPAKAAKKMGWGFWLLWIGSLAVGIGLLIWLITQISGSDAALWQCLISWFVVSVLQWLVMRQYIRNSWLWIPANLIYGTIVGSSAGSSTNSFVLFLLYVYPIANLIVGPLIVARGRRIGTGAKA